MSDSGGNGEISFEDAVAWFLSKETARKAAIIDEPASIPDEELDFFRVLITTVHNKLDSSSKDEAIEFLEAYGIEAYAPAIVERTLETAPPPGYIAREISNLSDEQFKSVVDGVIDSYIGIVDEQRLLDTLDISEEPLVRMFDLINEYLMRHLRGEITLQQITERLAELGIDSERCDYLRTKFEENKEVVADHLMFKNTQDILFDELSQIKHQQREMAKLLRELLEELQASSGDEDSWERYIR